MSRHRYVTAFLLILTFSITTLSAPAVRYSIKAEPSQNINLDTDHYQITILRGWISAKDRFFKALLSKKSKLVVSIDEEAGFFDSDKLNISNLYENTDISKDTDRPWGLNLLLLNNIPADADSKLNFKLVIHREDRITQMFQALEATKGDLPTDIFTAPWIGYSKAVGNIFGRVFGTAQPQIPFSWTGNIKLSDVIVSPGVMASHYIVLIAPNSDQDQFPAQVDASKLRYDEVSQQLKYEGKIVSDRSYLVLKVTKADGYDIEDLLKESTAPWAVLALAQFLVIPTADAKNADQLTTLSKNLLTQLNNEIDLLKREHRFSKYERGKALRSFAVNGRDQIASRCSALGVPDAQCPIDGLNQFISQIGPRFEIPARFMDSLEKDSLKLMQQIQRMRKRS